jgi:site-specific recombinase XerD
MDSHTQAILRKFEEWLRSERGLAAASVRTYVMHAGVFVDWLSVQAGASLTVLDARLVVRFVKWNAERGYSFNYLITRHNALRCFLRFLHSQGIIGQSLAGAVPPVAGWKLSSIPRGLEAAQVEALLGCFDVSTATGLRDRAMVLLMARLGLRRIEVARLRLDDVDWRSGTLTLSGKAMQVEQMPLLAAVGQGLSDYLVKSRPQCPCREVFVTVRKPYRPISSDVVGAVMGRASKRASIGQVGAHRLRHTLAIGLLGSGSGLTDIGRVLRHESALATAIYAKVDHHRLAELARPWPEHR